MKKYQWLVIGVFILISGCIPSIYPLYSDDTLAFKESLVGEWQEQDGAKTDASEETIYQLWRFEKSKHGNYYNLTHTEPGEPSSEYDVHLVKLGGQYYFDFFPDTDQSSIDDMDDFLQIHLFPVHTFAKVKFEKGEVSFYMFDTEWLEDLIEQRKIRIRHEKTDGMFLLSAGTEELQKFIIKYGDDSSAYLDPVVLQKGTK